MKSQNEYQNARLVGRSLRFSFVGVHCLPFRHADIGSVPRAFIMLRFGRNLAYERTTSFWRG
jgi:hypothetical protein